MTNTQTSLDPEFLLRAAAVFDPGRGLRQQSDTFLKTWALLNASQRVQAIRLWRSDRTSQISTATTTDESEAVATIASESQFLLRAAEIFEPSRALPNQRQMFRLIWEWISPDNQLSLQALWRRDDPTPPPPVATTPSRNVPAAALTLIRDFEGYGRLLADGRAEAYPDPIAGWQVPTIGYGTTRYPDGRPVRQGDVISRDQATTYLQQAVEDTCRPALERIPTWGRMNSNQRGALYSFAYNLGAHFYGGIDFTSITRVCDSPERWGDQAWVTEQFIKYRNPGSAAEAGLRRRRQAEATLFCQR
ncbi:MAG: lysozyme [Cyanobacteriota bacterium]